MLRTNLIIGFLAPTLTFTAYASAGGAAAGTTGACCFLDSNCIVTNAGNCLSMGGSYEGDNVGCVEADCYYVPATAINYQGRLAQAGVPVNEICKATFRLFDAETGGSQMGPALTLTDVNVVDGVFSVALDFGMTPLAGRQRWLEIAIGCPVDEPLTTLTPRQPLMPVPSALLASGANRNFVVLDESGAHRVLIETGIDPKTGDHDGRIGIAPSDGTEVLLGGHGLFMLNAAGDDVTGLWSEDGDTGLFMNYSSGERGAEMSPGNIGVIAANGPGQARLYIDADGNGSMFADNVHSFGDAFISGNLYVAGEKNFRIPNPNDPETDLVYACPEGPEAAVYVRGTASLINGRAEITFPEHFRSIIDVSSLTVHLTPRSVDSIGLAAIERSGQGFVAADREGGSYEFDYRVMAVRKGHEDFQVVRPALNRRSEVAK